MLDKVQKTRPGFSFVWMLHVIACILIALISQTAQALYSFPATPGAPMPAGCTGSAGTYTCANNLNLQDQVQFLDTGTVTITFNGTLNIGAYTLGSASQQANVTLIAKNNVTLSTPTIYASISAGTNSIITTGAAFIKGNLTTTSGSITTGGTVTGNIAVSSFGSVLLSSNAVVNGNITATTGLLTLNNNAVVNGNISTTSGAMTLNGGNTISSTVICTGCTLFVNGSNNTLGGDLSLGNVAGALANNTSYNGSISADQASIALGTNATVAGNITANSTGLGVTYIAAYQSVINGTVTASSAVSAQLFLYASTVNGAVQVTNMNSLLAPLNLNVFVDYASAINNSVTVTGIIDNYGKIAGCAKTTSSYLWAIAMELHSSTAGVCCFNGSTCSTSSCVLNLWNYKVNGCSTPANKFTCIDPSITNSNAASGHLFTQVANNAFNVDVVALSADSSVNTTYVAKGESSKSVTWKLLDCGDPSILANQTCTGATTVIATQSVTFTSLENGRKTISTSVPNAYKNLRCQVTDTNAATQTSLSTDNFAIRPASFTSVTTSNANADPTLGANATALPAIKAGSAFTLTASTGLSNYNGTPKIDTTKVLAHLGAANNGVLSGTFTAGSNGSASGTNFTYSEVGYFTLSANGVYDDTFTQVDSAAGDCISGLLPSGSINACSFGYIPTSVYYYGRFIPDHLLVIPGPSVTQACGSFSYYGQGTPTAPGLTTPFTLAAKNAAGATTLNYTGAFAGFSIQNWSLYQFSATPTNGATLKSGLASPAVTGSWINGLASVVATHVIDRPTAQVKPQTLTLTAQPEYKDGGLTGVTVSSSQTALSSNLTYLYGRVNVTNAHGSELLPLPLQLETQYWNSNGAWVRSVTDSCTTIPLSTIVMKNYKGNLSACETYLTGSQTVSNGKLGLKLSAPGVSNTGQPNTGSVDLTVSLSGAAGQTCLTSTPSATTADGPTWFGADPSARATFGIYKTPVIYIRESF